MDLYTQLVRCGSPDTMVVPLRPEADEPAQSGRHASGTAGPLALSVPQEDQLAWRRGALAEMVEQRKLRP